MPPKSPASARASKAALLQDNQQLRSRLEELEDTLNAIRSDEVDALVVSKPGGEQIFTLKGALEPYRVMVEAMSEGAVTLVRDGTILYCNNRFAQFVGIPLEQIVGTKLQRWIAEPDRDRFTEMLTQGWSNPVREELTLQADDASLVKVNLSMTPLPNSAGKGIAAVITDLTPVVAAAEARFRQRESENQFKYMFDHSPIGKSITSPSGELKVNKAFCDMLGYSEEELSQTKWQDITHPDDIDLTQKALDSMVRGERGSARFSKRYLHKSGAVVWADVTTSLRLDDTGEPLYFMTQVMDITELKRAEQEKEQYFKFFRLSTDAMCIADPFGCFLRVNSALAQMSGYSENELVSRPFLDFVHPEDRQRTADEMKLQVSVRPSMQFENRYVCKDGSVILLSWTAFFDKADGVTYATARDVTERRTLELALRKSEAHLRTLVRTLPDLVWVKDPEGIYLDCNPKFESFFGAKATQIVGKTDYDFVDKALAEFFRENDRKAMAAGKPSMNEEWLTFAETGYHGLFETIKTPMRDQTGTLIGVLGIAHDITERHETHIELQRANRALRTLSACNMALVHSKSETELLDAICRLIVEKGAYRMAWVGYAEQDTEKILRPVAHYGDVEGYLASIKVSWADNELGRGPSGTAMRTGTVYVNASMQDNPAMAPWREAALKHGYQSSVALPLQGDAGGFGVLTIYAAEPDAFRESEIALLQELAGDLAFGIRTLRARDENRHVMERLEHSMEDTIEAMAATVEKRDPYTAGHQVRVAELAVAIGREMGLPEQQLHGLRLGATIHDVGKIHIPAEILNRPGRLGEFEMDLIRTHVQVGYDIVKDIDFIWPVKEMVVQHHERIDGSGYPAGLKGDQIILEARILAVADVVEAMASHRPYRPALGVARGLEEIRRGSGRLFDAEVVAVCLRLFEQKRFEFGAEHRSGG